MILRYIGVEARRHITRLGKGYWGVGIQFCLENSLLAAVASHGPYDLIIHIGAHTAHEAPTYEALGAKRVVWVEADPEMARKTGESLRKRRRSQHVMVNAAASDRTGQNLPLYRFSNEGASSSLHAPGAAFSSIAPNVHWTGELVEVQTANLADILMRADTEVSDFTNVLLVIDVQGHEYEVLDGAEAETLQKVTAILCEVSSTPIYSGSKDSTEVSRLLGSRGFSAITKEPLQHGDMLFLNMLREWSTPNP